MRAYVSYFKLKFISGLQYRSAAIAGIATQFFFGFVYIMVYSAFYESGSGSIPMDFASLSTYLWLNQALFALVNQTYKDRELFDLIRTGNISYELLRPKDMYFMWFFKILGQRLANVILRFLPLIVVTIFLPKPYNLGAPDSFNAFILFIIAMFIGTLLITAISVFYPIVMLTTLNEKGIVNIIVVTADILSGIVVPVPFFPKALKIISECLPFQYVSDLPFRLYVGNINFTLGIRMIIIQIVRLFILIILGYLLIKKNLKRVEVQGG